MRRRWSCASLVTGLLLAALVGSLTGCDEEPCGASDGRPILGTLPRTGADRTVIASPRDPLGSPRDCVGVTRPVVGMPRTPVGVARDPVERPAAQPQPPTAAPAPGPATGGTPSSGGS